MDDAPPGGKLYDRVALACEHAVDAGERYGSVADGVKAAMRDGAGVPGSLVYIGGSNFVVAECISYLENDV